MLPRAATEYDAAQDHVTTIATRGVRSIWRRMPAHGSWERAWRADVGPSVQEVVLSAQEAAVAHADAYTAAVLAELGVKSEPRGTLNVDAFIGVAGDGRPVDSLTYGAVIQSAQAQYAPDLASLSPTQAATGALRAGGNWLEQTVGSLLADTGRAAGVAAIGQRPWVTGYVRMVSGGACSRCVVLAGKFYRSNTGFLRHKRCQCRHIPSTEGLAGDMTTNPDAYFNGLGKAEQDRVFTTAGAEAIRMGADVSQVVNARRGMQVAQVYGRKALVTTEATTARGLAGKQLGELGKVAGQRYRVSRTPRLMPESIIANAKDPADALRLLRRFGYVL